MPNFRGCRFTNAHETLIWAVLSPAARPVFRYGGLRSGNEDRQMRSDWMFALCRGQERLMRDGKKAHPTQKPEALLHRILVGTTEPGAVVLDPFFGTGTTGAVAKRLGRRWIGCEVDPSYGAMAVERIAEVSPTSMDLGRHLSSEACEVASENERCQTEVERLPGLGHLVATGIVGVGERVVAGKKGHITGVVLEDGTIRVGQMVGSVQRMAGAIAGEAVDGWDYWRVRRGGGAVSLAEIRASAAVTVIV